MSQTLNQNGIRLDAEKEIPDDTDILITHLPPKGIMDTALRRFDAEKIFNRLAVSSVHKHTLKEYINQFEKLYNEKAFRKCDDFVQLFQEIMVWKYKDKDKMKGFGALAAYNVAIEIGEIENIEPQIIYLGHNNSTKAAATVNRWGLWGETKLIRVPFQETCKSTKKKKKNGVGIRLIRVIEKNIIVEYMKKNEYIPKIPNLTCDTIEDLSCHDLHQLLSNSNIDINKNGPASMLSPYKLNKLKITDPRKWNTEDCIDWLRDIGTNIAPYADTFLDWNVTGRALNNIIENDAAFENLVPCPLAQEIIKSHWLDKNECYKRSKN